jgi:ABC-2 type transport system ATP-binding protein
MTQGIAVYPDLTVAENLRYFATMSGVSKDLIATTLQEIDMTGKADQLVSTLSGGEQSRTSLAIALVTKAKLFVLDEPTVGVDPVLRQQLWNLFNKLASGGCTLVISSHVMDEAERCDELVLIRDGEILAQGTPSELRKQTSTKSVEESFLKLVGEAS